MTKRKSKKDTTYKDVTPISQAPTGRDHPLYTFGRPPKFLTAEAMQEAVTAYFQQCYNYKRHLTMTGLAMAIGITRRTLVRYGDKDDFCLTVIRAREYVQEYLEQLLYNPGSSHGIQFSLKNNFNWIDKQELEQTGNIHLHFKDREQLAPGKPPVRRITEQPVGQPPGQTNGQDTKENQQ